MHQLLLMAFTIAPMLVDCQNVRESTMELYDIFHDRTTVPSIGGYALFTLDSFYCGTDGTMKLIHTNANEVQRTNCSKSGAEDIEFRVDINATTLGTYTAVGERSLKTFTLFRSCNNCSKCGNGKFCLATVQQDDNGCKQSIDSNQCPQKTSDYIVHPAKEPTLCHATAQNKYLKAWYWYGGQEEPGDTLFMAQENGEKLRINDVVIVKTGEETVQMNCPSGSIFADSTYSCEFIEEGGRKHSENVEKTCNEKANVSIPEELFNKGGPRMVKGNCTVKKGSETAFTTFRIAIMKASLSISYDATTNETTCSTKEKMGSLFSSSGKELVDKKKRPLASGSGPTGPKMKGHAGAGAKCIWNVEFETCDPVHRAKHQIESNELEGPPTGSTPAMISSSGGGDGAEPGPGAGTRAEPVLETWHIILIVIVGVALLVGAVVGLVVWRRRVKREEEDVRRVQKVLRQQKEREDMEYNAKISETDQTHMRQLIAAEQRRKMAAIENDNVHPELANEATVMTDGHLTVNDIKKEIKAMQSEKDRRMCVKKVIAEVDGQAKAEDLDAIPTGNSTHPVKVRTAAQVKLETMNSDCSKNILKFNINSVPVLNKAKAYIGQLPTEEIHLFNIANKESVSVVVMDPSLRQTELWKKCVGMNENDTVTIADLRLEYRKKKIMPRTGITALKVRMFQPGVERNIVMLFINQLPKAGDIRGMREMEDACAHMQAQSWAPIPSGKPNPFPNLLFVDSTGNGDAVTLAALYICRQQLMRLSRVNILVVMRHICQSRYGCWENKNAADEFDALILIYSVLDVVRASAVRGELWFEREQKGEQKSQKSQGNSQMKADDVDVEAGKGASSRGASKEQAGGGGSSVLSNSSKHGKSGMKKGSSVKEAADGGKSVIKEGSAMKHVSSPKMPSQKAPTSGKSELKQAASQKSRVGETSKGKAAPSVPK